MPGIHERSRGTGPRATVKKNAALHVGRWEHLSLAMPGIHERSRGTGHRATVSRPSPFLVGRWEHLSFAMPGIHERSRGTGPRATVKKNATPLRRARACPSPCVLLANLLTPVGKARLILTRSGSGEPELQRWAQCLPAFARPPRRDKYRNGVMKHSHLIPTKTCEDGEYQRRNRNAARGDNSTDFPPFAAVSLLIAHVGDEGIDFHLQARQVAS